MEGFKKPDRKARGKFSDFLYLDGEQTADSLSTLEGGLIGELRSVSEEESSNGKGISGGLSFGGVGVSGNFAKDKRMRYEEEVLRKRTGYSQVTTLLEKLRELGALGTISEYTPEVYGQVEPGELYEFKAEIRLHPFHQFVSLVQGIAQSQKDWGVEDDDLDEIARQAEDAFYGKNRKRTTLSVFADIEGAEDGYQAAMSVKKDNILVELEDFSGSATFVAQIQRKVAEGQKVPAARLVRKTPLVPPAEQQLMIELLPMLSNAPEMDDLGLEAREEDILLRHPAVIMKPLCIYRG